MATRRRPLHQVLRGRLELAWGLLRAQPPMTRLLGRRHAVNRKRLGIDLTWRCNVRCHSCNRSCRQAPCDEPATADMCLDQLERFVEESRQRGIAWQRVRVLGGEPTLHPQLPEVMQLLADHLGDGTSSPSLAVVTNGIGGQDLLARLPAGVEVESSRKDIYTLPFVPFNIAPRDTIWRWSDFTNTCWIAATCGLGLNRHGYYVCGIAGAIDRVLGLDLGRKSLPAAHDDLSDQMAQLCSWCGHFRYPSRLLFNSGRRLGRTPMSASWQAAYARYAADPPQLVPY